MQEKKELYQREDGGWALYPYLITCTDRGVQEQKYTDDIDYYRAYEEFYDDFVINKVEELSYTDEQIARLAETRNLKYCDYDEIYDYVINGIVNFNNKIFAVKNVEKNRADIDYMSIMMEVEL